MLSTLLAFEKDTGETMWAYKKEIAFMRKLILEGKWGEAEEFFRPLEKNKKFDYNQAMLCLKTQRLFELIENGDETNANVLESCIKEIQQLSTQEVFDDIMLCLNVTSINEIENYKHWTILKGRFECFDNVKMLLLKVYPTILSTGYDKESKVRKGLLSEVMSKVMEMVNKDKAIDQTITSLIEAAEMFVDSNISISIYQNASNYKKDTDNDNYVTFNPKALNKEIKKDNIIGNHPQNNSMNTIKNVTKKEVSIDKTKGVGVDNQRQKAHKNDYTKDQCDHYHINEEKAQIHGKEGCFPYYNNIYDVSSFKLNLMITDTNPIRTSCFSSKGEFFALGTNSRSLKIYDMKNVLNQFNTKSIPINNNSNATMPLVFEKANHHLGSLYCLDWSTSGKLIASGSNDKIIKIIVVPDLTSWSNKSNILEMSMEGHKGTIRSLVFDPLGDYSLYSGGTIDNSIFIWDTEKGISKSQLIGHSSDIHAIKWSNDYKLLGSSGKDKSILFWDVKSSQCIKTIKASNYDDINDISIHSGISNTIVAAAHNAGIVTLWDYNKSSLIKEIAFENKSEMRSIAFSPDGKYLAIGGFNKKITIIDMNDQFKIINTLEHLDRVVSVKWHPEKPVIVSTSADKTARVWLPQVY